MQHAFGGQGRHLLGRACRCHVRRCPCHLSNSNRLHCGDFRHSSSRTKLIPGRSIVPLSWRLVLPSLGPLCLVCRFGQKVEQKRNNSNRCDIDNHWRESFYFQQHRSSQNRLCLRFRNCSISSGLLPHQPSIVILQYLFPTASVETAAKLTLRDVI